MFLLPTFFRETAADRLEDERITTARAMEPVDWDPKIKFQNSMHIRGSSFEQSRLFDVEPSKPSQRLHELEKSQMAISPAKGWMYRERILPAGGSLSIASGNRFGIIMFDEDVLIPMLHKRWKSTPENPRWSPNPWMSFTPFEFFTLRNGTKFAKGHTIVAGLGMGYQLEQVCARKSVTSVTLVEKDEYIVEWVLPLLNLSDTPVNVVIGDANFLVPKMEANTALIDIDSSYGGNGEIMRWRCEEAGAAIDKLWIWGSS